MTAPTKTAYRPRRGAGSTTTIDTGTAKSADDTARRGTGTHRISPRPGGLAQPALIAGYSAAQMTEYGKQCVAAARAESAGMAECMEMVRAELVGAGVIGQDVPPMMVAEAVVRAVKEARRKALADAAKLAETLANKYADRDGRVELQIDQLADYIIDLIDP